MVSSTGFPPCTAPPAPQNKPKPHRCLTDCCAGYIDRVYIRQGGDGPNAKVLFHYDMYSMDQATRQLIEAEAAKRRKRPGAVRTARRGRGCRVSHAARGRALKLCLRLSVWCAAARVIAFDRFLF